MGVYKDRRDDVWKTSPDAEANNVVPEVRQTCRNKHDGNISLIGDVLFRIFRWTIILIAFGFVLRGWFMSYSKYSSKENSVSMKKNESAEYRYPSVTFCPMFKEGVRITEHVIDQLNIKSCVHRCGAEYDSKMWCQCNEGCEEDGDCCDDYESLCLSNNTGPLTKPVDSTHLNIDDIPYDDLVDSWAWKREEFMPMFSHPEQGDPRSGMDVLMDDKYWTETIPHPYQSGRCFTYDPPFNCYPGWWFGIRFGLKLPHTEGNLDTDNVPEKERLLKDMMYIYIHERGKFAFYMQDDFPSSHKLDVSWLRHHHENNIDLNYRIFTALDSPDRPCTNEPNYDFNKCVDVEFSKRRGCQAPWHYYDDVDIPICQNITQIKKQFAKGTPEDTQNYDRPFLSPLSTALTTGCPLPCTTTTITPTYSYSVLNENHYLKWMDNGSDWTVHLWFKNFQFSYEKEYVVCDWTCLIGEVGGNLGFFLGGSILAFFDIVLVPLKKKIANAYYGSH